MILKIEDFTGVFLMMQTKIDFCYEFWIIKSLQIQPSW
jgi:hypothetical protein